MKTDRAARLRIARAAQSMVNAQVAINRAVHEMNKLHERKGKPSEEVIRLRLTEAGGDLLGALLLLISTKDKREAGR